MASKKISKKRMREIEKYALEQFEKYIKIQKKNEKDLKYIG